MVPMVILIHAFPFTGSMWDACRARVRAPSVAPDLPGFGARAGEAMTSIDACAADVRARAAARGISRAIVGGVSIGGYIALALVRRDPSFVRGLMLFDTRAEADTPEARARRGEQIRALEAGGQAAFADTMTAALLAASAPIALRQQVRRAILAAPVPALTSALHALASRPDASDLLPAITVPTLVGAGAHDTTTPPAAHAAMAARIRGSRFVIFPDAGHLAVLEQPAAVAAAINEFVATSFPET